MLQKDDPKPKNDAENDPEEAIDTPEKVEESNDEKIDEDFPGYPHYPAKDDILNPENTAKRVDIDVENLTRSHSIPESHLHRIASHAEVRPDATLAEDESSDDIGMVPGTEADVTADDLIILGDRDEDMDLGEDEELRSKGWRPVTGRDLDLPDDEDVEELEAMGMEDEENSYYSLGGDEKEKLRENDDQNNF